MKFQNSCRLGPTFWTKVLAVGFMYAYIPNAQRETAFKVDLMISVIIFSQMQSFLENMPEHDHNHRE